ncbi:IS5 family transposase [Undibacterium sp. RTI2.1]|uniref:IS5 family transposase n=1 Tax=unclassified Undibacterium TaxID=2630295 RepID=UPI002B23671E|nr:MULTISPECIES: IS5 family transposase [unclassified Undibacterium]MEB0033255.1 IS5 family transposase [Undibacterium sp. RTI2.1]MEB0119039.1 IS5 family transposase [Undibacterium sp. RTI2.2]
MAWKNIKQRSLGDALIVEHKAVTELDDVHALINWLPLEAQLNGIHSKARGEKAWPPLMMFKALLLQSWYTLSDPQLEKQLARDLLFRRFVGLDISENVPDHSTLWRFRQKLIGGLWEALLKEINDQLTSRQLYIKAGEISIVDASVIQAKQNRPNKGVNGRNTQDSEAAYNVKASSEGKQKTTYGYKAHIAVEEDGFIKASAFTAGNVHDSQCLAPLLLGTESAVYADSAYKSAKHDALLAETRTKNCILERAYRNTPLTDQQKKRNRQHSGIRSIVERVFGVLKLHYGMGQARYLGLARNYTRFGLMCIAYNLKRGVAIQRDLQSGQESCA